MSNKSPFFEPLETAARAAGLNVPAEQIAATTARLDAALATAALTFKRPLFPRIANCRVRDAAAEPVTFELTMTFAGTP